MKQKLPSKLIYIAFFTGIGIWYSFRLYEGGIFLAWQPWLGVVSWFLGGFIGYWLLTLDRWLDIYFTHPESQLASDVRYYIQTRQYRMAWKVLLQRKAEQKRLTFRSAVFQVVWIILAFFTLTSTTTLMGKGIVVGLGLHLLLDEWEDYLANPEQLRQWLFWQIKREVDLKEQKIFLLSVTGLFLFFSLFLI